jgi:hypothetical protein
MSSHLPCDQVGSFTEQFKDHPKCHKQFFIQCTDYIKDEGFGVICLGIEYSWEHMSPSGRSSITK